MTSISSNFDDHPDRAIPDIRFVSNSSASSSVSSLEPLTETFEIPTPVSPAPSSLALPRTRTESESTAGGNTKKRNRKRSGSLSPANDTASSISDSGVPYNLRSGTPAASNSIYSRPWKKNKKPSSGQPPASNLSLPIAPSSPLIGDIVVSKSRLLITKTHVFYPQPSPLIPFQSCVLGFRMLIHTTDPKARVKFTQVTLNLQPPLGESLYMSPVIKAIYPTQGVFHTSGETSTSTHREENTMGLSLGMDPYGMINIGRNTSHEVEHHTSQGLLGSGVETSKLMLTLNEDAATHRGVAPSLDFAVLLYLPSPRTRSFDGELCVETTAGGEIGSAIRKMLGSPRVWKLQYDGETELGALSMGGVVEVRRPGVENYSGPTALSTIPASI